jgi:hypothetical protein
MGNFSSEHIWTHVCPGAKGCYFTHYPVVSGPYQYGCKFAGKEHLYARHKNCPLSNHEVFNLIIPTGTFFSSFQSSTTLR